MKRVIASFIIISFLLSSIAPELAFADLPQNQSLSPIPVTIVNPNSPPPPETEAVVSQQSLEPDPPLAVAFGEDENMGAGSSSHELNIADIWTSRPTGFPADKIRIHAIVENLPESAEVKLVYNVGAGEVVETMCLSGVLPCASTNPQYENEYIYDLTLPSGTDSFEVRVRVSQGEITLDESFPLGFSTNFIELPIDPSYKNLAETRVDIVGGIESQWLFEELFGKITVKVFYWKKADPGAVSEADPVSLGTFVDDNFTVRLNDLYHNTEYEYRIEAWFNGQVSYLVTLVDTDPIRGGSLSFKTWEIKPILSPTLNPAAHPNPNPNNDAYQTEAYIYAPITANVPTSLNIAEVWFYVWKDGSSKSTDPICVSPGCTRMSLGSLKAGTQLHDQFGQLVRVLDSEKNSLVPVQAFDTIRLQNLDHDMIYHYQFEIRTQYAPPDGFGRPAEVVTSPTVAKTFRTKPIDPMINPQVVNWMETEAEIYLGSPWGQVPTLPNTAEVRFYYWEQEGGVRNEDQREVRTFQELQTGDCVRIQSPSSDDLCENRSWTIFIDKLKYAKTYNYEVEIFTNISGQTKEETDHSKAPDWPPGSFITLPLVPEATTYVNQNIVTETGADLEVTNYNNFPSRWDIALIKFCYQKTDGPVTCVPDSTFWTLRDLQRNNWKYHVDQLDPGSNYNYWIDIYADVNRDRAPDGPSIYHSQTTFYTPSIGFTVGSAPYNVLETEASIKADLTGIANPAFIDQLRVTVTYSRPGIQPVMVDMTRCSTDDTGPPCLGNMMIWHVDLYNLSHLKNYSYTITVKHPQIVAPLATHSNSFTTKEIYFELTPSVDQDSITETEVDLLATNLVIPSPRIRPDIPKSLANVHFCFQRKDMTKPADCDTRVNLDQLPSQSWKVHIDSGLSHYTEYQYWVEIWTNVGHQDERVFSSGKIDFRTDRIAPVIHPSVDQGSPWDPTRIAETEVNIFAGRGTGMTNLPPPRLDGLNILQAKLFIWKDEDPRATNPVKTMNLDQLDDPESNFVCDPWNPSDCVYKVTRESWQFPHVTNLDHDANYHYRIEIWTTIPGLLDSEQSRVACTDLAGCTVANPSTVFTTARIAPIFVPDDDNVTEAEADILGPPTTLWGDGDGNGIINQADYSFWKSNFGKTGANPADYNRDGIVDSADYTVWRDNLGAIGSGGNLPTRPDIVRVYIVYWKDREPTQVIDGLIYPTDTPPKSLSLEQFYNQDWKVHLGLGDLNHNTLYHYRIEAWTNIPDQPSKRVFASDNKRFETNRIAPVLTTNPSNMTEIDVAIGTMFDPLTLPSRLDIALIKIYYQTVPYTRECQGDALKNTECKGEPVLNWVNDQGFSCVEGSPDCHLELDTRSVELTLKQLQAKNYNPNARPEDWFLQVTGLNHYSPYIYWIEIWTKIPNQTPEKVFDMRPMHWVDEEGIPCIEGDEGCNKELMMRSVCVKDLNDHLTCYDRDPDQFVDDFIYYKEPDVPTAFETLPIVPHIVYAFVENVSSVQADIVVLINNLPAEREDGLDITKVYFRYKLSGPNNNWQELEMDFDENDEQWKVHLDNLQPDRSYVYRVEVRTDIRGDGDPQPKEIVAWKAAERRKDTTQIPGTIAYLDRNGTSIQWNNLTVAGQQLVDGNMFYLKVNLNGVPTFNPAHATLQLKWTGVLGQPTFVYGKRVNSDPLSPDYRTVVFEVPTSKFPRPNYEIGLGGTIDPVPPIFAVEYKLTLRGTEDGAQVTLVDEGNDGFDFEIQNTAPYIHYVDRNGNPIPLDGVNNLLPDVIRLDSEYGPNGEYHAFRTLTIDMDGVDWPARLQLTSQDSTTFSQTFTFVGKAGNDGQMAFLIPAGFYRMDYALTLMPPTGASFVDAGSFEVPESSAPDVSTETILNQLLIKYNTLKNNYSPSNYTFWLEVRRRMPVIPGIPLIDQPLSIAPIILDTQVGTGGTITDENAFRSQLSQHFGYRIFARLIVRNPTQTDPNGHIGGKVACSAPFTACVVTVEDLFDYLVPGGTPSGGSIAKQMAGNILEALERDFRKIAAQQLEEQSRTVNLMITLRNRFGNLDWRPYGTLEVSINPDGTLNLTPGSNRNLKDELAAMVAGATTVDDPLNQNDGPKYISVFLEDDAGVRLSETRMWGFGNIAPPATGSGAGAFAVQALFEEASDLQSDPATVQTVTQSAPTAPQETKIRLIDYSYTSGFYSKDPLNSNGVASGLASEESDSEEDLLSFIKYSYPTS